MKILIPLAEGFEETEAVAVIDILRRAGIETVTAALGKNPVTGSHGIPVTADIIFNENDSFDAIVLPGGMPGSTNLKNNPGIIRTIKKISGSGGLTAAICAAPIVLEEAGILAGKKYTCYPGYEDRIKDAVYVLEKVVSDGTVITGAGAGCAPLFALEIVRYFKGGETVKKIKEQIVAFW